jgi:hypothetical protein
VGHSRARAPPPRPQIYLARDSFGVAGGAVGISWVATSADFTIVLKQAGCEYLVVRKRAAGGGVHADSPPTPPSERFFFLTDHRGPHIAGFLPDFDTSARTLWAEVLGDTGAGLHQVTSVDLQRRKQPFVYACEPTTVGRLKAVHKLEVCWWCGRLY